MWSSDGRPVPKEIRERDKRRKRENKTKLGGTRAMQEAMYRQRTDYHRTARASDIRHANDQV